MISHKQPPRVEKRPGSHHYNERKTTMLSAEINAHLNRNLVVFNMGCPHDNYNIPGYVMNYNLCVVACR